MMPAPARSQVLPSRFVGRTQRERGIEPALGRELHHCTGIQPPRAFGEPQDGIDACSCPPTVEPRCCTLPPQGADRRGDVVFVLGIQRAGGLVEQHGRRVLEQCAGDRNPLSLRLTMPIRPPRPGSASRR